MFGAGRELTIRTHPKVFLQGNEFGKGSSKFPSRRVSIFNSLLKTGSKSPEAPVILETIGCKLEFSSVPSTAHTVSLTVPCRRREIPHVGRRAIYRGVGSQASHQTSVRSSRGMLHQSSVSGKQVRWVMETRHQCKRPDLIHHSDSHE